MGNDGFVEGVSYVSYVSQERPGQFQENKKKQCEYSENRKMAWSVQYLLQFVLVKLNEKCELKHNECSSSITKLLESDDVCFSRLRREKEQSPIYNIFSIDTKPMQARLIR